MTTIKIEDLTPSTADNVSIEATESDQVKGGSKPQPYLQYKLEDVLISSYS